MSHISDAESAESNSTCSISLGVVDLMTVSEDSNSPSKVSSSSAAMTEEDNNVEEGCYEAMKRKFTKSGMHYASHKLCLIGSIPTC